MAFTIGAYGLGSLVNLGRADRDLLPHQPPVRAGGARHHRAPAGFSILRFLAYIKDELLIVLGTSSSETVLPHMIQKMQRLGASKSVVGLVIPTGYSFNLDGTNIYMTLATLFLAQATNTPLTLGQELDILVIAMLTSKGASGVTGAGFITLAATLAIVPDIPIAVARDAGRHRQVHERVPRADQPHRQRRRHRRHQPLGGRARRRASCTPRWRTRSRSARSWRRGPFRWLDFPLVRPHGQEAQRRPRTMGFLCSPSFETRRSSG